MDSGISHKMLHPTPGASKMPKMVKFVSEMKRNFTLFLLKAPDEEILLTGKLQTEY